MKLSCIALVIASGACAGTRSGLPGDARLVTLDEPDMRTECQFQHDAYPPRMIACPMNNQVTIFDKDVDTCVSDDITLATDNPICAMTVAQYEACEADLYAEPDAYYCMANPVTPMSCLPLHTADCSH